jgi:hypothetical protein
MSFTDDHEDPMTARKTPLPPPTIIVLHEPEGATSYTLADLETTARRLAKEAGAVLINYALVHEDGQLKLAARVHVRDQGAKTIVERL